MMAEGPEEGGDIFACLSRDIRAVVEDNARFLARLRDDTDTLEEELEGDGADPEDN
jgi:hypothetical protein